MRQAAWVPALMITGALALTGCGGDQGGGDAADPVEQVSAGEDLEFDQKLELVLASVGGQRVYGGDVLRHMEEGTGQTAEGLEQYMANPDILQVAMAGLVDQFVWGQVAKEEGYELLPAEQRELDALKAQFLATRYVAERIQPMADPSSEEVYEYYLSMEDRFRRAARVAIKHILVNAQGTAEALAAQARGGADFGELARKHSLDDCSRDIGGAIGYIDPGKEILCIGRINTFEKAALAMEPGEIRTLETNLGWHVLYCADRQGGETIPLEDVREEIEKHLRSRQFGNAYNQALLEARDRIGVQVYPDNFSAFTGIPNNCERLFATAHEQAQPSAQVELYRRIVFDFPDCELAPEAQFMVGYLSATATGQLDRAKKALLRLQSKYPDSKWRPAGDYILERLDDPESLGSPEAILAIVGQS